MEPIDIVEAHLFPRLVADRSHRIYQQDLGRHMFRAPSEPDESAAPRIRIHMMEDIGLHFVQDPGEGEFTYLRELDRDGKAAWDDYALISKAFINLRDLHGDAVKLQQLQGGGQRISSPGRHDASFLLLGNLWHKLEEELGANMYAAAPGHNMLFVAPQDDRSAILTLQGLVRAAFFEAPHGAQLSKAIYQRWDGEWKIVATGF
jgi:hypothetical protein